MDRVNDETRAAEAAHHTAMATNGIATVCGHIARLRDLTTDPERDAAYRQMLADLGAISATLRKQGEMERAA